MAEGPVRRPRLERAAEPEQQEAPEAVPQRKRRRRGALEHGAGEFVRESHFGQREEEVGTRPPCGWEAVMTAD